LLELPRRRPAELGDQAIESLKADLHTVGWLLALEAHAGSNVVGVLGPGRARVAPPAQADVAGLRLDPGLHARDFLAGAADPAGRRRVTSFVGLSPAAAVELRVQPSRGPTDLLVFHAPPDEGSAVGLLERCDHLLAGWWRLVPRYARFGAPPVVVILSPDHHAPRRLAAVADPILVACLARIGQPPQHWDYPGRAGVVFAAESDLHAGVLEGWRLAELPPVARQRGEAVEPDVRQRGEAVEPVVRQPGEAVEPADPAAGGDRQPLELRRAPIVELADAPTGPPDSANPRSQAPWR
jgi:hypothetical protein